MIGYILVAVGVVLAAWLYIRASYHLDEREAEMFRAWRERERLRAESDHHFTVYEKQPLYDHERRGDFE
jgi:hypothetical protein